MKVLVIESDALSEDMKEFVWKLNICGHYTLVVEDCYKNLDTIRAAIMQGVDVIAFETTYVYRDRFSKLFELSPLLQNKVQLWNCMQWPEHIIKDVPEKYQHLFDVYDCKILNYISGFTDNFLTKIDYK